MWRVIDSLFLGDKHDSLDIGKCKAAGITHIVNCARECESAYPESFDYLNLELKDPDTGLQQKLFEVLEYVDAAREHGAVLVHCSGAISRSPSVVLAYLIYRGQSIDNAVASIRNVVQTRPNYIFIEQVLNHFGIPHSRSDSKAIMETLSAPSN